MTDSIEKTIESAEHFLRGGPYNAEEVLAWRKDLREQGYPALARSVSRKLAESFIAGASMRCDVVDKLWKACKSDEAYSQARRILLRRRDGAPNIDSVASYAGLSPQLLREQAALMTSKDPDLAASMRHIWALQILEADLATSTAETLGIAGGIWKRCWESDGLVSSLEKSLQHYLAPVDRGRQVGVSNQVHDKDGNGVTAEAGYPAINAAFVLDLLAHLTEDIERRNDYTQRARELRQRICNAVQGDNYWILVTLAEAQLGLGEVGKATALLSAASKKQPDPWERETTARQLVRLGSMHQLSDDDLRGAIAALVGPGPHSAAIIRSVLIGKLGLALSGGGFRASLYHLGVLARLAESDLLRHVEVLSTVSGGSMVGAAYYLRLRRLLGERGTLTQQDYVSLIGELIEDFRIGTSANLRSSLLTNFSTCRAVLSGDDKKHAMGVAHEIFQSLYSRTEESDPNMVDLSIRPLNAPEDFHPRYHNIQRDSKVPALILNATSLNTGHSWQFTTTSMGESPFSIVAGADSVPRLRRAYYTDQQGRPVRSVTLSQAVAASACVPGLFAPLILDSLYPDYEVLLVDGGVHDNQGALALLQEDCNVLIVSDASGQLQNQQKPAGGRLPPLLRSSSIFQERMRQVGYTNLQAAQQSNRLRGLAYVHMTQDLCPKPVDWLNCEDPSQEDDQLPASASTDPRTRSGIWKPHQTLLATIRTDLDAFSDIEAAALMASGYMAMSTEVQRLQASVPALKSPFQQTKWWFDPIIPRLRNADRDLAVHLEKSSIMFLRIMHLDARVRGAMWFMLAAVAAILAYLLWQFWGQRVEMPVGKIAVFLVTVVVMTVLLSSAGKSRGWVSVLYDPLARIKSRGARWFGSLAIWALARLLIPILTRRFLARGRLENLK